MQIMFIRDLLTTKRCIVIYLVLLLSFCSDCVIYRLNGCSVFSFLKYVGRFTISCFRNRMLFLCKICFVRPILVGFDRAIKKYTEYLKMPPIYHLDRYEPCILQPNGTYCYVQMELLSDGPSELLQMIHEYSEHTSTHFNHTKLHHGICLTDTCKHIFQDNKVGEIKYILERCLNDSLWRHYNLKTRISDAVTCQRLDETVDINIGDICAAAFFVCLIVLNIIGSIYDVLIIKGGQGNTFLLCFSLKSNFGKLTIHKYIDPHEDRLKGIYGVRTIIIMLVILAHSPAPLVISSENPHEIEQTYYNILCQPFYNGTLIVQTLFVITGCLLAYKYRVYIENNKQSWMLIPRGILRRWVRLTPAYAVVLIFTSTWMRFIASGPLWETTVGVEVADCQRNGWWNLFYLNNYIDNSQCMVQTWFLAANLHLYILGLFVCFLANTSKRRMFVLPALFVVGMIIPPIHTYLQDLDANVLISPESARNFFITDPTFNHSYKRSHTNIPGFVVGIVLGNIFYSGLTKHKRINTLKKLGIFYYISVPMAVALLLSGIVFYGDRPRLPLYLRTILSALLRPMFAFIAAILLLGMVFKFENIHRKIFEWRGWRILSEVSYSAYLIHVAIIRIYAGMNTTLLRSGLSQCVKEASGIIFMSFLMAFPFWLLVEAPLNRAILGILGLSNEDKKYGNHEIGKTNGIEQETSCKGLESKIPEVINIRL